MNGRESPIVLPYNNKENGGIPWCLGRWIHLKVHTDLRLQVEGRDIVNSTIYVAASNAYSMKWTMILDGNSCRSLSWRKIPYFYWWPLSSQDFCKAIILRIRTGEIWLRATGRTKTYILKQQKKVIMVMYNSPWNRSLETDLFLKNLPFCSNWHDNFWRKSRNHTLFCIFFPQKCVRAQKGIIFALEKIE